MADLVDPDSDDAAEDPRAAAIRPYRPGRADDGTTEQSHAHASSGNFTQPAKVRHNLKFGADFRVYRAFGNRFPLSTAPDLNFGTTYTRGPFDNSSAAPIGQELASMLLGIPDGVMVVPARFAMQDRYLGAFVHDDFKVTSRLTLNLGLRYEFEQPLTERYDRLVAGFAFDTSNPIEAAARANYALNPIPELPVDAFRVRGGLTWVGQGDSDGVRSAAKRTTSCRGSALAYQPTDTTVLRAGYGMFYDTIGVNTTRAMQTGFSQSTPIQASLDNGLTFVATIANPFPQGLLPPRGPAGGLTTNLGQNLRVLLARPQASVFPAMVGWRAAVAAGSDSSPRPPMSVTTARGCRPCATSTRRRCST